MSGISWYEAVAYSRYRRRALPTIDQWLAMSPRPYAGTLAALSNMEGDAPRPVGRNQIAGPHGTYDTHGNVREWLVTADGERRWIHGWRVSELTRFRGHPGEAYMGVMERRKRRVFTRVQGRDGPAGGRGWATDPRGGARLDLTESALRLGRTRQSRRWPRQARRATTAEREELQ